MGCSLQLTKELRPQVTYLEYILEAHAILETYLEIIGVSCNREALCFGELLLDFIHRLAIKSCFVPSLFSWLVPVSG